MNEKVLHIAHPVMFRNRPVLYLFFVALIALYGLGLLLLLIWWINCYRTTLIVTEQRTTLRTGILAKATNDVMHNDVRNVQVKQGILQRLLGVGWIGVSSAGQSGVELQMFGLRDPQGFMKLLDQYRELGMWRTTTNENKSVTNREYVKQTCG